VLTFFDLDTLLSLRSLDIQQQSLMLTKISVALSFGVAAASAIGITAALMTAAYQRRSIQPAVDALKVSQAASRAWLTHSHYESGILKDSVVDGRPVRNGFIIRIHYKNAGTTPALNVNAEFRFELVPPDTSNLVRKLPNERKRGTMVLAAGENRHASICLDDAQAAALVTGQSHLLIEAVLTYSTVLGEREPRMTRISYIGRYTGGSVQASDGSSGGPFNVQSGPLGDFMD
jgi:hypothetical protein